MFRKSKKVNLPYRQPTQFEMMKALIAHEEREAARRGEETFREANDFNVEDDPDPLERFFSQETPYEEAGEFMESMVMQDKGFTVVGKNGELIEFDEHGRRIPQPAGQRAQEGAQRSVDRMAASQPPVENAAAEADETQNTT